MTSAKGFKPSNRPPMCAPSAEHKEFLLSITLPDECWHKRYGYFKQGNKVAELYQSLLWMVRENIFNELKKKKISWIDASGGRVWFEYPSHLNYSKKQIAEWVAESCLADNGKDGWEFADYPLNEISLGFPASADDYATVGDALETIPELITCKV